MKHRFLQSLAVVALVTGTTSVAVPTSGWSAVSEIVVTTRKREENLQDIPIAVTAVGFETLTRTGTSGLEGITKFTPSFVFDQNSAQKDVRIAVRGISPTRGRSGVAFMVDGIDVTSEAVDTPGATLMVSQRLLSDIERVESVKGPQSALYGRAAFSGAINYVTKDAPEEFSGNISVEAAEHEEYSVNGSVGGPIVDGKLGLMASGFWWDEKGQYENSISGDPLGGGEGFGGALTINFDPTDAIKIKTRLEYSDEEWNDLPRARKPFDSIATLDNGGVPFTEEGPLFEKEVDHDDNPLTPPIVVPVTSVSTPVNATYGDAGDAIQTLTRSEHPVTGEDPFGTKQEMFRASIVASWDIDAIKGTLTSYTGYVDSEMQEQYDWDANALGRPDALLGSHLIENDTDTEIFSQELRYQSDFDGPFQTTLGVNYWSQKRVHHEIGLLGNVATESGLPTGTPGPGATDWVTWQDMFNYNISNGFNVRDPRTIKDKHFSLYGMLEWELNDNWKATIEGRYSEDDISYQLVMFDLGFVPLFLNGACSLSDQDIFGDTCVSSDPDAVWSGFLFANNPFTPTIHSNSFTPKGTLEWRPTDDVMVYASISKAAKPAGFNFAGGGAPYGTEPNWLDGQTFKPEKMIAYELGTKTSWNGGFGDLTLNAAAFYQDFQDKLVNVRLVSPTGSVNSRVANAGGAEVWGAELDAVWATPIEGLVLRAAYTWHDTEYTEFEDLSPSEDTIARVGNCTPVDEDSVNTTVLPDGNDDTDICRVNYSGRQLERAPEHAFTAAASLIRPLANSDMSWFVEGDTQYQGERFEGPDNVTKFEEYWLFNLRAGLEGENWEALLFVDNVLDDDTIISGSQLPDFSTTLGSLQGAPNFVDTVVLPPKRQIGLRAKYKF